jgi:hypothetical protein
MYKPYDSTGIEYRYTIAQRTQAVGHARKAIAEAGGTIAASELFPVAYDGACFLLVDGEAHVVENIDADGYPVVCFQLLD